MAVSKWFDANVYMSNKLAQLKETDATWTMDKVVKAFADNGFVGPEGAEAHFMQFGQYEDVAPNAFFNPTEYYRAKAAEVNNKQDHPTTVTDPEVAFVKSAINGLNMGAWSHYKAFGNNEKINPSNSFDTEAYVAQKVIALNAVLKDGQTAYTAEDVYAGLKAMGMSALEHFMIFGGDAAAGEVPFTYNGTIPSEFAVPDAKKVNPAETSGTSSVLTTGSDIVNGTSGNDTIIGSMNTAAPTTNTLNASDVIDGGAGQDTLAVSVELGSSASLTAPTIRNVEIISVRSLGSAADTLTVDGGNFVGATEFVADRSTSKVAFTNIGKADVTVVGNGSVVGGAIDIDAGDASVTDPFVLNLKGGTKTGAINVDDGMADWTEATINSSGAFNRTGALNLSGTTASAATHTIKNLTINASSSLVTGNITGFDTGAGVTNTITVKGTAGVVSIGELAATIDVVDAAGLTAGGLIADITGVTETGFKFTGGKGNDQITTKAGILSPGKGAVVDAGAGDADLLAIKTTLFATANAAHKSEAAIYKNFEILRAVGVVQDATLFTGSTIGSVQIDAAAATAGFTKLSAAQAANVTLKGGVSTTDVTIQVKDATEVANSKDIVKLTVDDLITDNGKVDIKAANMVMDGVETLDITAVDHFTAAGMNTVTGLKELVLHGDGNYDLTLGAVGWAAGFEVNATDAKGTVTIDAKGASHAAGNKYDLNGYLIKGSLSNENTITDTDYKDTIVGGDKADSVTFKGGKDTVTLGKGADEFDFGAVVGTNHQVTFKFAEGDSVGLKGAANVTAAFDGGLADTIDKIANGAAATTASAGQKFVIDTYVDASSRGTVILESITFGASKYDNVGDFAIYNDAAANTVIVFQDTNKNQTIDADDFMIKLVGDAANQFNLDEFTIANGNLVYTSTATAGV